MSIKTVNRRSPRRVGRFRLDARAVEHACVGVSRIMSQCIIVRAEMSYLRGAIEYEAISWRFREVEQGFVLPTYQWIYNAETGELDVQEVMP
ncbi:hypothetical protein [Marinobacter sp.]|uniref:hypothetical protein n=1 Tax=Marinobacter sp. TaxID=50741 RepID=UPI003A8EF5DB